VIRSSSIESGFWRTLWRETIRGKSLLKTLSNLALDRVTVAGRVVDLGSRDAQGAYWRFIRSESGTELTFTDLQPKDPRVVTIDLEERLPFESSTYDHALLMHVLELIYGHLSCLKEIRRILKPGGQLSGVVPFLQAIHAEPVDYYRYSAQALERAMCEAGFAEVRVEPVGFGPFSAAAHQCAHVFKWKPVVFLVFAGAVVTDRALNRVFRGNGRISGANYPLAYVFWAKA
jgi:SAM-dependent methyltransferase